MQNFQRDPSQPPSIWTVGDLRRAITAVADEAEIRIYVAESAGREKWDEHIATGVWVPDGPTPEEIFVILTDFPPGLYPESFDGS